MKPREVIKHAAKVKKPVKQYLRALLIQTGLRAIIQIKKTPPGAIISTSMVIRYHGLGIFETLNTIYQPKIPPKKTKFSGAYAS